MSPKLLYDRLSLGPVVGRHQPTLHLAALLIVFVLLDRAVERVTGLSESSYFQTSLVIELARKLGWLGCVSLAAAAVLLTRYGKLGSAWGALECGAALRTFVVVLIGALAWCLSTYGYNYYFDQGYYVERVLLVALVPLTWWRPVFALPFLALAYTFLWQLAEPALGGSIFPHKLQILRAVSLFAAAFLVYAVTGYRRIAPLLVLLCSFVAAAYWVAAVAKYNLSWLSDARLLTMPVSAYAHGWLAFLDPATVVAVSTAIGRYDPVLRALVLTLEGACLFFLWRRSLSMWLLGLLILFHCAIFALYGFFFWTWMLLDGALMLLLWRAGGSADTGVYNVRNAVLSVGLILAGSWWARPPQLGWFDTPLTYTYRIQALDAEGRRSTVHPYFLTPYEDVFTMTAFSYLATDHPRLVGAYGATADADLARELFDARTPADVFAIENEREREPDRARAARFYRFLEQYFATRNRRGERLCYLRYLRPPQQFWSFRGDWPDVEHDRVAQLAVVEVTTFFNGKGLEVIRESELARIKIPH
ncbi:MAG TPA: hypothetical protein VM692_10720 [Gammaproteobacteria bacterium]|nr:hypothetical protein [Gammaproteobacteria bacterium]